VQIKQPIVVEGGVPLRADRKAGFHSIISFADAHSRVSYKCEISCVLSVVDTQQDY
jgi:hypothetical protein